MATLPLPIPTHPVSRPTTPVSSTSSSQQPRITHPPASHDNSDLEMDLDMALAMADIDDLDLPALSPSRPRSDTAWSEASDSPPLQTPQTPSILGVLAGKRPSYTFQSPWAGSLSSSSGHADPSGSSAWSAAPESYTGTSYTQSPKSTFRTRQASAPFFDLDESAAIDEDDGVTSSSLPLSLAGVATQHDAMDAGIRGIAPPHAAAASPALGSDVSALNPAAAPLESTSPALFAADSAQWPATSSFSPYSSTSSPSASAYSSASGAGNATPRSLGAAVRRGIDRSKAPFRRRRATLDAGDQGSSAAQDDPPPSRFKSLITKQRTRNRAQSLSSTTSGSSASIPALASRAGSQAPSVQLAFTSLMSAQNDSSYLDDGSILPGEGSTLQRTVNARMHHRFTSQTPPFNVVLATAGLHSPSAPVGSDELVWGTLSYRAPVAKSVDHFGTKLPRELKVAVFKALLDTWMDEGGTGRWDGDNGGRRELIRLSRVSKEWRSLCFDGQLWATADFTPLAAVLHPGTVRQILSHSRPCIKDMSLRGLEAVTGWVLTGRELVDGPKIPLLSTAYSSLTSLDLRGCHTLSASDVIAVVQMSPNLKKLNVKGLRLCLHYVLRAVRQHVTALEELDVSRCWGLEFLDIEAFVVAMSRSQKNALQVLRIAGLTSTTGGHLLQHLASELPNLHTLDLLGCRWLGMSDIQDYITGLDDRESPLKHLVISSCTNLTAEAIELLVDRIPNITRFEAAGLEGVFYLDPPPTLARLVRSMPLLERLDLDATGRYGGVCDRLLDELVPGACPGSPLTESRLVELRIGSAKNITPAALLRLVNALPKLARLEADGTETGNAVLRAFLSRSRAPAAISLVDCHRLTHEAYTQLAARTRARAGWDGYTAACFAYSPDEVRVRPVLKTFWAWRGTTPPRIWREAREAGEATADDGGASGGSRGKGVSRGRDGNGNGGSGRGGAWWRGDDVDEMERGACMIM